MLKSSTIYVRQYALNTLLKSRTSQIDLSLTLFSFWFLMFFMFWIVLVFKQIYEFGDSLDLKFWVQQYSNPSSHSVFPKTPKTLDCHYVKSARIQSYSGPHFPAFGLNTDRYEVSIRIQSDCRKIRTRITPYTANFHALVITQIKQIKMKSIWFLTI